MKNLTLILFALIVAQSTLAQTESCKVLLEEISGTYTGKCENGLAHGKGKSIGEDTYIGNFNEGLPHGKGKYIYSNGDVFEGYWKNGNREGKGKFTYTLNGTKHKAIGYWKENEFVGVTDPDIAYRVTTVSGIVNYQVKKMESVSGINEITFTIKSAFTDFAPRDLKIEKSSGQIVQTGKMFGINHFSCPLYCEISYTILVGETKKICRFNLEILKEGKYMVTLSND